MLASLSTRLLGRWRGAILAGIGIALYTALTGGRPSAVCSAWMGGLGLLAAQIGRRQDGLNSLGITAAVMAWPFAHFPFLTAEFFGNFPGAVLATGRLPG